MPNETEIQDARNKRLQRLEERWSILRAWADLQPNADTRIKMKEIEKEEGSETLPAEVLASYKAGGPIAAIRIIRERTGLGLKDSKDKFEAILAEHGQPAPSYLKL